MFEIISALIPFFLLGIVAAGLSRVSGVALSMIIVMVTSYLMSVT